jgi:hypothetical protein
MFNSREKCLGKITNVAATPYDKVWSIYDLWEKENSQEKSRMFPMALKMK